MSPVVRPATPADAGLIHALIVELARFEKLEQEVVATPEGLHAALFSEAPRVFCDIAEADGEAAGFALWFYSFRTFQALPCLYVEDVFVEPAHRGSGLGRLIFADLARRALAEKCDRMEWSVLDWNAPAIGFYERIGSRPREGWTLRVLTRPALDALAA